MSVNLQNLTPNKYYEHKITSLKSTPKFSALHSLQENIREKLIFNQFSKTNFNRNINNTKSSSCFLIPISKNNTNKKTNDFTHKKTLNNSKTIFNSDAKININYSFSEIKSKNDNEKPNIVNNFLNKKRKHMTSEEIELEKIKKEKELNKKLMQKNKKLYLKSFNYSPMKITPSPLTTFIPFKLSCNNNSKFIKQGKSNTIYEVNKQNQKIRLKMQQKIEKLSDNKTKDRILLNNVDYLKKQNELYNDLFNKENIISNGIFNNININHERKAITPIKEFNNKNLIFNSYIKKFNENNNILNYIESLRNLKNNN